MTPRQRPDTPRFRLSVALAWGLGASVVPESGHAEPAPAFERVMEEPCRALALDRPPYVAALGDDRVRVIDARGTHEEALPNALRGAGLELGVFFGRDYRVRVAGTAHTPHGDEVRYYRSLGGRLEPALAELGPLGARGAPGLVAVLGTADPEIVCRPGARCLFKRVSGWVAAPAPPGLERVGISLGRGWAIAKTSLFTLGKDWVPWAVTGPWQAAEAVFVRGDEACVIEHAASRLHHFDGRAWHSSTAPIDGPRSLWGSEDALWVAGDGGAARLVGAKFETVDGPSRVVQVLGRTSRDVWLCSAEGVFRSR